MKQLLLILSISAISIISCKNHSDSTPRSDSSALTTNDSVIVHEADGPYVLDSTPTSEGRWHVDTIWEKK
jgi:hypothetical protein